MIPSRPIQRAKNLPPPGFTGAFAKTRPTLPHSEKGPAQMRNFAAVSAVGLSASCFKVCSDDVTTPVRLLHGASTRRYQRVIAYRRFEIL
jgi:hypothetical protein